VFLCSAPSVGQPNCGLTGQGLRLACAEPGDQLAIFGEALRELTERATYLYEEAGRYWFSTQATLNRVAEDRAKAWPEHEVDAAIADMLRADARTKGGFHGVFAAPDDPVTIDEAKDLSLVILGPASAHAGKGAAKSPATDAVAETLTRCRASQRRLRNTLLFVAADEAQLGNAREVMRKALAWKSIVTDGRLQQQMTKAQATDASDKAKTHGDGATRAVRAAWSHVLYPVRSDTPGKPFDLEHILISARERAEIPKVVYDKAKADGIALERLGSERLWLALQPIWPEDRAHLPITEVADWFGTYVYMPKVRDRVVLDTAVRDAVAKLDPQFGYADGVDAGTGRYRNLIWGRNPPELFPDAAVLVRAAEALKQLADDVPKPSPDLPRDAPPPVRPENGGEKPSEKPAEPRKPRRFYGSVELDLVRPVKSVEAIVNAVVAELQRTHGATVKLTLEIEATAPEGFDEADVGVVRDNTKQLKFRPEATGFSE
jgi:hypothetical protein